jgi:parallel beta-helix repeat protein
VRRPDTVISGNTFNSTGLGINTSQLFVQNSTSPLQTIVAANTFDKGVYVDGSTTVGLSIQGFVSAVPAATTINVLGGTYTENVDATGNSVTLAPGANTSKVVINGSLALDANDGLAFDVNGAAAGTGYDQWEVAGAVTLGGAASSFGGSYAVFTGQKIVLVSNDMADVVAGVFAGLSEGATIPNFIGSGLPAQISYTGGDGNDVELTILGVSVVGPDLVIESPSGSSSGNDSVSLAVSGPNLRLSDPNNPLFAGPGAVQIDANTIEIPLASLTGSIVFQGTGGDDVLTLDFTSGSPVPPGGIAFHGGSGNDGLRVVGNGQTVVYTPDAVTDGDGTITVGGSSVVFTGLEPVDFVGVALTLSLPGANDVVDLANGFLIDGVTPATVISGTSGGVGFENARARNCSITINTTGVAGTDTITLTSMDNAHLNSSLAVTTGVEAGDSISVNGTITVSGTTTLNATAVALNANVTNGVTGSVATAVTVAAPGQIQDAIDLAAVGDTIFVGPGTYQEDIVINKVLTLQGAGAATAIIQGVLSGANETVLLGSNQVIDGFTITRATGAGENNTGLTVTTGATGSTVRNCVFTGNRTAIYLNGGNSQATITRNTIDDNRTGFLLPDGSGYGAYVITENNITNNKTFGVLFNAATAIDPGFTLSRNNISGNYGVQVENNSGSTVNASANWWGNSSPVITASTINGTFPPAFNYPGPAVPQGAPYPYDITGSAATSVDYTPLIVSGVDSDLVTPGFQPNRSVLRVVSASPQSGSAGRIHEGAGTASTGGVVNVDSGTYTENITLDKRLTLDGAGSGVGGTELVSAAGAGTPVISVTGSGSDAGNQLTIKDLSMTGTASTSGSDAIAVYGDTPVSFITVDNVNVSAHGHGVHYRTGTIANVTVSNSTLSGNGFGVRVASAVASIDGLTIDGCTMSNNNASAISTNPSGVTTNVNTNFTITDSVFANNSTAGTANQHDLSFFGFHGNATLTNVTLTAGNGASQNSNSYGIVFTNGSSRAALGTVTLTDVTVQGHVGKGALTFQLYNDVSGVTMSGVDLRNCVAPWGDLILDNTGAAALDAGDTDLKSVVLWNSGGVDATGVGFYAPGAAMPFERSVLADNFAISNQIGDVVDFAGVGLIRTTAGKIYVSAASAAGALYRAIGAASTGDEIVVEGGTPFALSTEITPDITFLGTFAINSTNIPTDSTATAVLTSFMTRKGTSTVTADMTGMNANQIAAVNANLGYFNGFTGAPVSILRAAVIVGYAPTIQSGIDYALSGDTVQVSAGTYAESVTISQAVDVRGPNWNVSPNGGARVAEAVIVPLSTNTSTGAVVSITSSGVLFRGFTVDGDNTALADSGVGLGGPLGTSIDAARCVFLNANGVNGITISKNIAKNAVNGLRIEQTTNYFASGAPAVRSSNILLDDNLVQDMTSTGIRLGNSMYAKITNNTVSNADNGIAFSSFRISDAGSAADRVIQGNTISARFAGIWTNLFHASPYALVNNTISVAPAATAMAPTPQNRTAWYGIMYSTVSAPQNFTNQPNLPQVVTPEWWTATGNVIDGAALEPTSTGYGYWLFYVDNNRDSVGTDHFGQISGGSVSNVNIGIMLKNRDTDPATNFGTAAIGAHAAVSGVAFSLNAGGTGFRLIDDATWTTSNPAPLLNKRNVQLAIGSGSTITGGAIGLHITRPASFAQPDYNNIVGAALSDLAFSGQTGDYITLVGTPNGLDATLSTFDTANGATAAQAALFDIEDKITHKLDDTALGLVRVKMGHVFVSATGSLDRGITAASVGDVVNVEDGYPLVLTTEITKNVTFAGTFTISSANIPADTTATTVLTSFMTRKGTSTVTADMTGMNANQIAAVNANLSFFNGFTGAPVTILRAAVIVGYAPTIQSGIDYALSGDTVQVSAGTYTENVTINGKNISLVGPNAGLNDAAGTRVAEAVITAASNAPLITVEANVTSYALDGFRLVGADYSSSSNGRLVWAKGQDTASTIRNNVLELTSAAAGTKRYIWLGGSGSVSSGSSFISGAISHNQFKAAGGGSGFNGIIMQQWSANFTISGNTFQGMTGQRNVLIWHPSATTIIENNEFSRVDAGGDVLYLGGPSPTVGTAGAVVRNNKFSSGGAGMTVFSYGTNITVTGNDFSGVAGSKLQLDTPPVGTTINASGNWWGAASGATIATSLVPGTGAIDFTPFLTTGADVTPATVGFQGDFSDVTVTTSGGQSGVVARIQEGVTTAATSGVVNVEAGTYAESVTISQAVDVRGPNWNVSPNGGARVAEAVIVPPSTNTSTGAVVTITSSGVLFRGFTVDGDNTALADSGVGLGGPLGTSIDAARCVFLNANGVNGITISKNIAKNAVNGLRIEQTTNYFASGAPAVRSSNILLDDNLVQDMTGTGIRLGNSMYAKVTNNTVSNADNGIAFSSFRISDAGSAADRVIQGNTISARFAGIWTNLFHASPYALVNNTISVAPAATAMAPTPQNRTAWYGIMYSTVSAPQNFTNQPNLPQVVTPEWWTATGNVIDGAALEPTSTGYGYWLFYVDNNRDSVGSDHFGQISGGSVSNVSIGIMLKNRDTDPATSFGTAAIGAHAAVSGVAFSLNAGGTGLRLIDDATWTTSNPAPLLNKRNVQLAVGTGNTITGGAIGLHITRPASFAQPDYNNIVSGDLSDLAFSGQTGDYITLVGTPNGLDGTSSTFETLNGATAAQAALFDIEDKVTHKLDDTALGLVRVKAGHVFVSATGSLDRGITAASVGDVVNVEDGYPLVLTTEITKNVTFAGTFTISSANIPADTTATTVLTSFMTRKGTSTVTADMTGMNANQIAAVNANLGSFNGFTGAPVSILRAAVIVGYAPTIQSGIDYALSGDTVQVSAGTYAESVSAAAKAITLSAAGTNTAQVVVNGSFILDANDTLTVELNGLIPGTEYDQWVINGSVTLGGSTLILGGSRAVLLDDAFTFISNDAVDAITGTFNALPEGVNLLFNAVSRTLTYIGGDGNDVVLKRPPLTPIFVGAAGGGSGSNSAPNADATGSIGRWESIRSGAVLSSNGHIAFRGHLELGTGTPPVTVNDFQGIWRYDGTDTRLKARSGTAAPDSGGALYDILPLNPAISRNGLVTFFGGLRFGTGVPAVNASTNYGLWTEMGGSARLLLREGDPVVSGKTFRSSFAVATSNANTAALNARLSSGTAMIHLDVNTPAVQLTVVAEEGQAAPGGGTWIALEGNASDPRLSANGDLGFIGWELEGTSYVQGIYSRLNTTAVGTSGATLQARVGGTAPGTGGATFSAFERPTIFNGGMAFRGFLNTNGDNAAGDKGQGVWSGTFGALLPVVRTGDTNAQIPTIPAGSTVGSVWSPFSNALGSITMRVGLSSGGGEGRAIIGSTGGTMRVIAKVGDAAPGFAGETFTNFDHPVIGDGDQVAFTASTNAGSYGIWKEAPGGGALSLVMKVGETISTSEGDKVVSEITLPGATSDDRMFELNCMDATGRLLIHVSFSDGTTSLLLGQ